MDKNVARLVYDWSRGTIIIGDDQICVMKHENGKTKLSQRVFDIGFFDVICTSRQAYFLVCKKTHDLIIYDDKFREVKRYNSSPNPVSHSSP